MRPRPSLTSCSVAAPAAALLVLLGAIAVASTAGSDLLWRPPSVSTAEAAALGDAGTVVARLEAGEAPDTPGPVIYAFRFGRVVTITPLEAAIAARRPEIVRLLVDHSARIDASNVTRLRCFAERGKDREIIAELERHDATPLDCTSVTTPW